MGTRMYMWSVSYDKEPRHGPDVDALLPEDVSRHSVFGKRGIVRFDKLYDDVLYALVEEHDRGSGHALWEMFWGGREGEECVGLGPVRFHSRERVLAFTRELDAVSRSDIDRRMSDVHAFERVLFRRPRGA